MPDSVFSQLPLNKTEVPQHLLDIDDKRRSNPLPWNGQFSPELVETLLRHFGPTAGRIYDPFVGSGTVLLESARLGLAATGVEINPAPVLLSSVYRLCRLPVTERARILSHVDSVIGSIIEPRSLFSPGPTELGLLQREIISRRQELDGYEDTVAAALIVLADFGAPRFSAERTHQQYVRLRDIILTLPETNSDIDVVQADARATGLPSAHADIAITSPPYINVFNYHQKYRRSVEALEWDVLRVARSEIGSNRKHRGNRFLTVIQYCHDMTQVLNETARVVGEGQRLIFVVGRESNVRGTSFHNGMLVAELAYNALGIPLTMRQERRFTNRYGQTIVEDILHFIAGPHRNNVDMVASRKVAHHALEEAFERAGSDARRDIEDALEQIEAVCPSPLFNHTGRTS